MIPANWRRIALALLVVCVAGVAVLGVRFHGQRQPSVFDRKLDGWAQRDLAGGFMNAVVHLADAPVVIGALVVIVVVAMLRSRRDVAVLAVLAPSIALALTEWVLKPLIDRRTGIGLAFPSGHESGVASVAAILGLLLLPVPWPRIARLAVALGLLALVTLVALALVVLSYHYATDTIGAVGVSIATVLSVALVIEQTLPLASPVRRGRGRSVGRGTEDAG